MAFNKKLYTEELLLATSEFNRIHETDLLIAFEKPYITCKRPYNGTILLDGIFSIDELKAIIKIAEGNSDNT